MKSKLKNSETSLVNVVSAAEEDEEAVMSSGGGVRVLKSSSVEIDHDIVSSLPEMSVKSASKCVNNLNRTHSNSSCNSDSDYNSITNSSSSGSCSSPLIDSKAPSINSSIGLQCARVIAGFYGKSKTLTNSSSSSNSNEMININSSSSEQHSLTRSTSNNSEEIDTDIDSGCGGDEIVLNNTNYTGGNNFFINYGDDVGFMHNQSTIINRCEYTYFGIADGVSANRQRGYDARLFPIALLNSCVKFIKEYRDFPEEQCKQDQQQSIMVKETVEEAAKGSNNQNVEETNEGKVVEKEVEEKRINDEEKEATEEELDENNDEEKSNIDDENENEYEEEEEEEEEEDYVDQAVDVNVDEGILSNSDSDDASSSLDCKYLYNILVKAHDRVQEQKIYGSSTVCLLSLRFMDDDEFDDIVGEDEDESSSLPGRFRALNRSSLSTTRCVMSTCNLGDSGYMIIRNKQVIYKSQSQSHRFNAPYQIGCTPPELLDHDLYRDSAEDSVSMTHRLEAGDFLLISSDGLFDNLYEDEIALLVDKHISERSSRSSPSSLSSMMAPVEDVVVGGGTDADSSIVALSANSNNSSANKTVMHQHISSEILSSACQLLVERASLAGIKKDDMLIMLIYIM